ncbi:MAG: FtsQ-type POTRA domain-containing protein [Rhodothermales bacterium]
MARDTKQQQRRRRIVRRIVVLLGLGAVVALGVVGWRWQATVPVRAVTVSGAVHADTSAVLDLAAVPDSAFLFSLDPEILADRVRRHPWVAEASVTRWMTGTLAVDVTERVPVALVLDGAGRPSYFFDAAGFMMPLAAGAAYDVPLFQGRFPAYQPTQPVEDAAVLDLLAVLAAVPDATDALVSSVERAADGSFTLATAPTPGGASIPVALGRSGFAEKLGQLQAFWDQAVLPRPDTPVRRIDLRFDGQIVTSE